MMRTSILCAVLAQAAFAAAPLITELQPRGSERGKPFTLKITGRNLGEGARIWSTMPASFTLVAPSEPDAMTAPGSAVAFLVEPRPDAAAGVYPLRVETPAGVSNILLLAIGDFPEVAEEESSRSSAPNRNNSIETAEAVPPAPVTVNGTLRGADRDVYRLFAKAGERRVFEVEARHCGSAIDPVLRLLDGSGKQLARNDDAPGAGLDARIDYTFPREGYFYLEVHDARFSRQVQNFYRLKIGSWAYADGLFPLGGPRGRPVEVALFGDRLSAPVKITADLRQLGTKQAFTTVALPGSPAIPFLFGVSDLPEVMEPLAAEFPVPGVVNGRLSADGEVDRYRLKVKPGERYLFEIQARELGTSRLEAVITVSDANGKRIDSAGDQPLPEDVFAVQGTSRTSNDPFLNLTVPESVEEIELRVEDIARRGGPLYGYRLIARREAEDFRLMTSTPYVNVPAGGTALIAVSADRRGYDGPIQLTIPDPPKGITVEGGYIPREYVDAANTRSFNRRGILTVTAEPGVEIAARELVVWGEGRLAGGAVVRREARGTGLVIDVAGATAQGVVDRQRPLTAPWLGLNLPMAVSERPAATLEVRQTGVKHMEEGERYEFEYRWHVQGRSVDLPREVGVEVIGARDIRVTDMQPSPSSDGGAPAGGTFHVNTTRATDPARYDLYITGRVRSDAGEEIVVSRAIPLEVTERSAAPHVASNR